jgi:hypothetical protein
MRLERIGRLALCVRNSDSKAIKAWVNHVTIASVEIAKAMGVKEAMEIGKDWSRMVTPSPLFRCFKNFQRR